MYFGQYRCDHLGMTKLFERDMNLFRPGRDYSNVDSEALPSGHAFIVQQAVTYLSTSASWLAALFLTDAQAELVVNADIAARADEVGPGWTTLQRTDILADLRGELIGVAEHQPFGFFIRSSQALEEAVTGFAKHVKADDYIELLAWTTGIATRSVL